MQTLTLVRGMPGSGKSTLAQALTKGHMDVHLEADFYFLSDSGGYEFDSAKLGHVHLKCKLDTMRELMDGKNVVVSNTFTTLKEMRPYYEMSLELGAKLNIITCQGEFGDIHNVPQETLERMRMRFFHGDVLAALKKNQ